MAFFLVLLCSTISSCVILGLAPRIWLSGTPKWQIRKLRDDLVDEIIAGTMPNSPAVWDIVLEYEDAANQINSITMLDMLAWAKTQGRVTDEEVRAAEAKWLEPIPEHCRPRALWYRNRLARLEVWCVYLGSWLGVFMFVRTFMRNAAAAVTERMRERNRVQRELPFRPPVPHAPEVLVKSVDISDGYSVDRYRHRPLQRA